MSSPSWFFTTRGLLLDWALVDGNVKNCALTLRLDEVREACSEEYRLNLASLLDARPNHRGRHAADHDTTYSGGATG